MPATEALLLLEQILKRADIDSYKDYLANYHASLPLYVNCEEIPQPKPPPEWMIGQDNEEDDNY